MSALDAFDERRALALRLLQSDARLTRKAGQFLGQCAVDPLPLTDKQNEWLRGLAERAGLEIGQ